jgi:hypothetical protein
MCQVRVRYRFRYSYSDFLMNYFDLPSQHLHALTSCVSLRLGYPIAVPPHRAGRSQPSSLLPCGKGEGCRRRVEGCCVHLRELK